MSYLLSTFLISVPCIFLLACASVWGNAYGIGGYQVSYSPIAMLTFFLLISAFDTWGKVCSLFPTLLVGLALYIQFFFASFLFCGFIWMLLWFRGFGFSANCGSLNIPKFSRSTLVKQHFSMENHKNTVWGFKDQSNTQLW